PAAAGVLRPSPIHQSANALTLRYLHFDGTYRNTVRLLGGQIAMPVETTYTSLRERLASVLDQVANDHDVVIVRRRHAKDVALIPAEELSSLLETAHLLRSPKNAQRLLAALQRATRGKGKPESLDKLRREMGLGAARCAARGIPALGLRGLKKM